MEKQPKEVKVSKMVIQLTDEQISLSMNEAKKLYEALAELFGKKTVEHVYHNDYWYYRPQRLWDGPYYTAMQSRASSLQDAASSFSSKSLLAMASNGTAFEAKGQTLMCNLADKK